MGRQSRTKRVVIIGGAGGSSTIAKALTPLGVHITLIQTPADDGGSSGDMRRVFKMMPPGDTRRALLTLSTLNAESFFEAFKHRYSSGLLKGQVIGNLMLAGLTQVSGSFETAIEYAKNIFKAEGDIIPASLTPATLYARLENGHVIIGETNIDVPKHDGILRIQKIWFKKPVPLNPRAARAIAQADLIVIGPGDLYTSILPNLLVTGMPGAIKRSRANKVFIANSTTKYGETYNFTVSDFVKAAERYLKPNTLNYVIGNQPLKTQKKLPPHSSFVAADVHKLPKKIELYIKDLTLGSYPAWYDPTKFTPIFKRLLS